MVLEVFCSRLEPPFGMSRTAKMVAHQLSQIKRVIHPTVINSVVLSAHCSPNTRLMTTASSRGSE